MSESSNTMGDYTPDPRKLRAAALRYNAQEDQAPVVVAAGSGYVAQKIIEVADECGVMVYHDDSAATLLAQLNLGQSIPPDLYQMVVDIYLTVLATAEQSRKVLLPDVGKSKNVDVDADH